ncbi:ribosome maturation factor RimM [Rickettsia endosymbiont of Ceutorhynchus obstrictus]|uniref:ribosome maturation factor RimM n=1 Tax=Rickettsia endosymbiont of Ceutorhynchus obstrictus TaxID=3066249 RepID=UPI003132CB78
MTLSQNLILVGVITSSHGVQGNVIIKSFTYPAANIAEMKLVNKSGEDINIKLINQNSQGNLICKFNKISNREEAASLKGYKLFCLREVLPELEEDEFYITDLNNLPVFDQSMKPLGKIKNIFNFGAGDLIEIEFLDKKIELLPFTKIFFPIITKDYVVYTPEVISS